MSGMQVLQEHSPALALWRRGKSVGFPLRLPPAVVGMSLCLGGVENWFHASRVARRAMENQG
jgi:hypothetical protein